MKRGFTRVTLCDHQTTRGVVMTEWGSPLDIPENAGPAYLDYDALFNVVGNKWDGSSWADAETRLNSREYTFVLADGNAMGADTMANPTGGGFAWLNGWTNFDNAEYVVLRNIRWEMEFINCHPSMALQYSDRKVEGEPISFPSLDATLDEYLDGLIMDPEELEGGDVYYRWSEVFRWAMNVTLMRCPQQEQLETVADMDLNRNEPRTKLLLAPLGLLINREYADAPDTAPDPETDMLGTTPGDNLHDRVYRAFEPYDRLRGVLLYRRNYEKSFWMDGDDTPMSNNDLDIDTPTEGYEPEGFPRLPKWYNAPRTFKIHGGFRGEIVVSPRRNWPLVLTVQSLPVRVRADTPAVGGETSARYYRPYLLPIRWRITAEAKVR